MEGLNALAEERGWMMDSEVLPQVAGQRSVASAAKLQAEQLEATFAASSVFFGKSVFFFLAAGKASTTVAEGLIY